MDKSHRRLHWGHGKIMPKIFRGTARMMAVSRPRHPPKFSHRQQPIWVYNDQWIRVGCIHSTPTDPPPLEWHLWIIYPPYLTKRRLRVTGRCRDIMIGEHQHIHYMHRKRKVQWNHHKLFLKSHVRPHLPPPLMRHPPPDMIALEDVNHTMQSKVSAIYDSAQQTVTQGLYSSKNHKDITAWSQRDYFCGCN